MKNTLFKTLKGIALSLLFLSIVQRSSAQNSSSNAIQLQNCDTSITAPIADSVVWYQFIATKNNIAAQTTLSDYLPLSNTRTLSLFDNNLNLISFCNDSLLLLNNNQLILSNNYYLKITGLANDTFNLQLETEIITIYDSHFACPTSESCNLLSNGYFNDVFQYATVEVPVIVNGKTKQGNLLQINAFGTSQDTMGLVDTNKSFYTNMVCGWQRLHETPNIKNDTVQSNFAYMWGYYKSQECISTRVKIYPTIDYAIDYDLKRSNGFNASNGQYRFGFRPYYNIIGPTPSKDTSFIYHSKSLPYGSANWYHVADTFNLSSAKYGTIPMKQLIIYPFNHSQTNNTSFLAKISIDNILLRPLTPPPTNSYLTGLTHICSSNTDSIFQYKIINYDSLWTYFITVNNNVLNYSVRVFTDTFSIDIATQSSTTITLKVCDLKNSITVYRCCDPFSSSDSAIYYCNDSITSPQTIDGENISICGWLQINADVTIKNSNIKFGQKSGIRVGDGYSLTFDNDSLQRGCEVPWIGVFANNSNSSIIIKNSYISGAESAIVSSNNTEIRAISNDFVNNLVGIWIRNYNPPSGLIDDGWIPPPPSNTYIAGNSFVNLSYYNMSNKINAGIRIDTVYNITIGDDSLLSLKNTFQTLRYGIKAIYSDVKVINNEFKNIYQIQAKPNTDTQIRPQEAAVHCTKAIVSNSLSLPPPSQFTPCISPKLEIGGIGNSINTFDSCNFGVYTYGYETKVLNNIFTNQFYNAVYALQPRNNSVIDNNTISMSSVFHAKDTSIIHAAINCRKVFNSSIGIDLDIIGNTINNTRTGISLLNTSSSAANGDLWVRVGNNLIYFDSIASGIKYRGIKIQGCDRIRVAGNNIENLNPATNDPEKLQGIHMAQCMGTWIADNKGIVKMNAGIYAVGNCHLSQFACNDFDSCAYGIYFKPNSTQNGISATIISQQGYAARASDNYWTDTYSDHRIAGNLNSSNYFDWYFRGDDIQSNKFATYLNNTNAVYYSITPILNTNVATQCVGIPDPNPDPNDWAYAMQQREERFGELVREEVNYEILVDEFEAYDEAYLFEMLYANPELMNLGNEHDTSYINFYNYRINSTIAEFVEIQELIDSGNVNQALQDNGILTAQTVIETNQKVSNDIYLNTWAQNIEIDSIQRQTLFAIAMLTPYVGGEGVYSARAMLGIDPEDYNLPYRLGHFTDTLLVEEENNINVFPNPTNSNITIEFNNEFDNAEFILYDILGKVQITKIISGKKIVINLDAISSGIYFYTLRGENFETFSGKIIKQ